MYAEGLFTECADQFQQELTVDDAEGSQHDQTQEDQHKERSQPAGRDHGYLYRAVFFKRIFALLPCKRVGSVI